MCGSVCVRVCVRLGLLCEHSIFMYAHVCDVYAEYMVCVLFNTKSVIHMCNTVCIAYYARGISTHIKCSLTTSKTRTITRISKCVSHKIFVSCAHAQRSRLCTHDGHLYLKRRPYYPFISFARTAFGLSHKLK